MFTCDEKINISLSNEQHVQLALKETDFSPSNEYQKHKINNIISQSVNDSRIEIINSIIQAIETTEKAGKDPLPFIKLFRYLSDKFEYKYNLDCETTNLMTCYKYNTAGSFDKISIPVSRIKYIIQHDRVILGVNTSIDTLSRSRVSCITDSGEEFRVHPVSDLMICFMSDEVYKSATRHLNNVIQANKIC